jgi:serine/threonine protein kinase/tetratricopeptide (TPR) repeat protein
MRDRLNPLADESTLTASPGTVQVQLTARPGDRFGPYKILEEIGQGGCGAVFIAEQEQPVRRRVALKVIKLGMDTREVIARFEAERQALAMMDHPNIARVLDAGATDTGRPFFVMELVRGVKITDYCDQNKLSTTDRLKLFIQVCQAVQHAHQKGIIHRDLKPSNILVTLHDGVPVPKVIDFGIAKATANQKLTDKTIYTALEQFIGTPAYMSPEQAEVTGLDIDTRSDIYSLGVLLYELLVGETPFSSEELLSIGLEAMRRTLREKEPAKPSTKLTTMMDADLTAIAQQRQSDPFRLIKSVRGDLDWIVMKCLEKDRSRRYETANGLAMDIERHLTNEPVLARPQSSFYRLQKVVRRNRVTFVAGGAVIAALIIGAGVAFWEYLKEKAAHQRALVAEKAAKEEATKSAEVARILKDMLNGAGPAVARGRDTKVLREILDQTAARIGNELTNQPEVEAQLRIILAKTYSDLGEWTNGLAMAREALRLRRALYGEDHLAVAECLTVCGAVLLYLADFPNAETNHREALRIKRKLLGEDDPEVARSIHNVGLVLSEEGRLQEAEPMLREAVAKFAKLNGEETVDFARALRSLGGVLVRQGNLAEAEPVVGKVAILYKKLLGVDHPDTVMALNNLATLLRAEQKPVEAEPVLREVLVIAQRIHQGEHPMVATTLANLGVVLADQDKLEEAETVTRQALAMQQKLLGNDHPDVALSLGNLGDIKRKLGKPAEGEQLLRQAIEILKKSPGTEPVELSVVFTGLAKSCRDQGKLEEAEKAWREGLGLQREERGKDAPEVADFLAELADVLVAEEKLTEAESSISECLAIQESKLPNDWVTFSTRATLGEIFWREKKYDQAEKFLLSGYDAMNRHQDKATAEQKADINETIEYLIKLYESWGKPEKAVQWRGLRPVGPAKPADVSKPL